MTATNVRSAPTPPTRDLAQRLSDAEATIEALLSGQIDAVVDSKSRTPVLLAQAQEQLRRSQRRLRDIIDGLGPAMFVGLMTPEGIVLEANRPALEAGGLQPDDVLGKRFEDTYWFAFSEKSQHQMRATIARAAHGDASRYDMQIRVAHDQFIDVDFCLQPLRDEAGTVVFLVPSATVITARKETENALRESTAKFAQLADNITDVFWIRSPDMGEVLYVSPAFERVWGRSTESLYAHPGHWTEFIVPEDRDRVEATFATLAGETPSVDIEYRIVRPDGEARWVRSRGFQVRDGAGKLIRLIGIVTDITESRRLQAQLMVSDRMASVGTLAAGLAHEINNPLAAVIANLDFMAESLGRSLTGDAPAGSSPAGDAWLREDLKGPLEDAREAAQRVRFIVRDLKIFSRSPSDERPAAVDVRPILESSLRMAWNEIRHRAHLVKDYDPVPGVLANEARLGQVFLNLIVNAAQALPEGHADHNEIRVRTRLAGARVVIEVSDTGPGIPPEIIGRIFDAFFTTKAVGVGTGLGLAICQRIVTDMGGELTVTSTRGKGTTFCVALPVAREEDYVVVPTPPPVDSIALVMRRGRILVVDDEEILLRSVKRILSKDHDVVATAAAAEALALCAAGERFDLILCDLMMPDMTGMELHGELSRIAPEQAAKMIFVTGGAFTAKALQFLSETSREHIEKPFHPANLRAIVQRYLRATT
jgi:PAS domain S-box-containing protein